MKKLILTLSVLFAIIYTSAQTIDLSSGLVAWYPFNGNANDSSGNGNNGTVYGATLTTNRFGIMGKAYEFAGNSDRIVISQAQTKFGFTNQIGITTWFRTSAEIGAIVTKWQGNVLGDWFI